MSHGSTLKGRVVCFSDPRKTAGGGDIGLDASGGGFFKEKDQEMAATPLKTNGCPLKIDGWKLEDVFPIEVVKVVPF